MTDLPITGHMIAWTPATKIWSDHPTAGQIEVGVWPDKTGWSDRYAFTTGSCWIGRRNWSFDEQVAQLFIDFHTCVVRDHIDPLIAHREFNKISEYRESISQYSPTP